MVLENNIPTFSQYVLGDFINQVHALRIQALHLNIYICAIHCHTHSSFSMNSIYANVFPLGRRSCFYGVHMTTCFHSFILPSISSWYPLADLQLFFHNLPNFYCFLCHNEQLSIIVPYNRKTIYMKPPKKSLHLVDANIRVDCCYFSDKQLSASVKQDHSEKESCTHTKQS